MKNKKTLSLLASSLSLVILPLYLSFGGASMQELQKTIITEGFGGSQLLFWLAYFVFAGLITAGARLYDNRSEKKPAEEKLEKRAELLASLKTRYQERLEKKMDNEINFRLKLSLQYTSEGTSGEGIKKTFRRDYDQMLSRETGPLYEEFEQQIKSLLLLGEAGSGKTVLLLRFALYFLKNAQENPAYPIPIILNLASWRKQQPSFKHWLQENLTSAAGSFGTSAKYARELVSAQHLFLLLDGFDEIPGPDRESFLSQLKQYVNTSEKSKKDWDKYPQLILSSRRTAYLQADNDASVKASLVIPPLQKQFLLTSLEELSEKTGNARELLRQIENDPAIAESLSTAFSVHLALHMADSQQLSGYRPADLLRQYCDQELEKISAYRPGQKRFYLHSLAYLLAQTKKVVTFELTDIHPGWTAIRSQPARAQFKRSEWLSGKTAFKIVRELLRTSLIMVFLAIIGLPALLISSEDQSQVGTTLLVGVLLVGIPTGILLAVVNGFSFKKEYRIREVRQFNPAEFSGKVFAASFKRYGVKLYLFCMVVALMFGVIYTASLIKKTEGSFTGALTKSLGLGLDHYTEGFEFSVLPLPLHYLLLALVTACLVRLILSRRRSAYQNLSQAGVGFYARFSHFATTVLLLASGIAASWWLLSAVLGFLNGFFSGPFHQATSAGDSFLSALGVSLFLSLPYGLYMGLIDGLFTTRRNPGVATPYKRLLSPFIFDYLKLAMPVTLLILLILFNTKGVGHFSAIWKGYLLITAVIQVPLLLLCIFVSPIITHFATRLILFVQGRAPLRYRRFLDRASKTGLMEKDGGEWRFRHQLIQDYFDQNPV